MEIIIGLSIVFALLIAISLYCFFIKDNKETANFFSFSAMIIILIAVFLLPEYPRGIWIITIGEIILGFSFIFSLEKKEYRNAYGYSLGFSAMTAAIIVKYYFIA